MFTDDRNAKIELGPQLGSRGGEGCVYEVKGAPHHAAKIYHQPPDGLKLEKLNSQISLLGSDHELRKIAAWPERLIYYNGKPSGFLMAKAKGKPIHFLYRPNDRIDHFPTATWQSLITVSQNVAAAFHSLHARSIVMADINESNLLVTENGEVRLIDCDSYQIRAERKTYLCNVGVGMWTPPELQGKSRDEARSEHHDGFGLALLIFHLLFMGKHPYSGVPHTPQLLENPPSLEECIKRFQFAHTLRGQVELSAPPFSLPLTSLPESLIDLFEQAFLTKSRPTPATWHRELGKLEFQKCRWGHVFYRQLSHCPWCVIWNQGGTNFFIVLSNDSSASEIENLLRDIAQSKPPVLEEAIDLISALAPVGFRVPALTTLQIPLCAPAPFVPPPKPIALAYFRPSVKPYRPEFVVGWIFILISILLFIIAPNFTVIWLASGIMGIVWAFPGWKNPAYSRQIDDRRKVIASQLEECGKAEGYERTRRARQLSQSHDAITRHLNNMGRLAGESMAKFDAEKRRYCGEIRSIQTNAVTEFNLRHASLSSKTTDLLRRCRELPQRREEMRISKLKNNQMEGYLKSQRISDYKISQIGPARAAKLARRGIITAWDVLHMGRVDGLNMGQYYLESWASGLKKNLRVNTTGKLSDAAEHEIRRDSQKLEKDILDEYQVLRGEWRSLIIQSDIDKLRSLRAAKISQFTNDLKALNQLATAEHRQREQQLLGLIGEYGQAQANAKSMPIVPNNARPPT